jgi:transcriptional regulator with XRE-family HTH domain
MAKAKTIGQVLREQREFMGFGQTELAELAQVAPNTLGRIERGETEDPSYHTVVALCRQLDMTTEDLEDWRRA